MSSSVKRLRVGLLVLLNAFGFVALTASFDGAVAQPIIPYLSTGYRYAVVDFDGLPGFEQPGFDDSGFSVGDAAFGTGGYCPLDSTIQTEWPLFTDLLVRKEFTVAAGASPIVVAVAIDNDAQVFINGTDISGGLRVHEGCAERDSFLFTIPDAVLNFGGTNLLAVRARDRGGLTYFDVEVRGEQSLTALSPAKVWVGLKNSDDVGLRLDLKAQVSANGQVVAEGQLNNVFGGSSGFNNARLSTIPFDFVPPFTPPVGVSRLEITVSARRTCFDGGHNSGTARLWFNDGQANSRFDATTDGTTADYFLQNGGALGTGAGSGPKKTADAAVTSSVPCPDRPFTPFGTWSIALP
jgi:hypothetical protein